MPSDLNLEVKMWERRDRIRSHGTDWPISVGLMLNHEKQEERILIKGKGMV